MLCTQEERQACIDAEGAYFAERSKAFHTWAGCPGGQGIRADNLTSGRPRRATECDHCAYHAILGGTEKGAQAEAPG